jgi:hypothetical protein
VRKSTVEQHRSLGCGRREIGVSTQATVTSGDRALWLWTPTHISGTEICRVPLGIHSKDTTWKRFCLNIRSFVGLLAGFLEEE